MCGYHPGEKACFLSVAHFAVCWDFQADLFEDAWKICLSSPDMIVWLVHLLPVSCLNITERIFFYRKKFIIFKKNRDEKEQEFKSPGYWSGQQKKVMKYWLTITVIVHFPNILFPWRDTHLSTPSNLQDLKIFLQLRLAWLVRSPAGMTCCEMRKCVVHLSLLLHVWLNYRKLWRKHRHAAPLTAFCKYKLLMTIAFHGQNQSWQLLCALCFMV